MLLFPTLLAGQSVTLFDIDATDYPRVQAKCIATDADGHPVTAITAGAVQLGEDGFVRPVTRLTCPPLPPPVALSSVLTIDISASMKGDRMEAARAAARTWIDALPPGRSECAITSFNHHAFVNQDFTTDRAVLFEAVENLSGSGGSDYHAALLAAPAGALEVSQRARHRRVVVLLTDGMPPVGMDTEEIIAEAQRQDVVIYAVLLGVPASGSITEITEATGGYCIDEVASVAQAEAAFRRIYYSAQRWLPCEIQWRSDGCALRRSAALLLPGLAASTDVRYWLTPDVLPQFVFTPSGSLHFGEVQPGTLSRQSITMTAQGAALRVDDLHTTHALFRIVDYGGDPPPFLLAAGESRTLTIEYAPEDSSYAYCRVDITGDACFGNSFHADGGWTGKTIPEISVRVEYPDGGEQLVAGSDAELLWEGVMPGERVRLEYSIDSGENWMHITNEARDLRHSWRVPATPSDDCLLRVTAAGRPAFSGTMLLIPAGTFLMGNVTGHPEGLPNEQPVHEVTVTRPFLMSRTPVTQRQYQAVMGTNPGYFDGPDLPVEQVTWYDAVQFCNELSRQEGLDPCYSGSGMDIICDFSANGYRLPTEAEWEYACRAGTETDFYSGNMTHSEMLPYDPALHRTGWYGGNAGSTTHPVGMKEANAFGLHDMHGNVWEWCWDMYDSGYYAESPATDPQGPGDRTRRVLRGGSWNNFARVCRSASRGYFNPGGRNSSYGFRLVRTYQ
ncbi:MAG: SUMF1/EgtB/PvdO family nonheme iron enzyme [Bacteroidetes bacterium]|nr:SUMF1/EgtB/PvdO family nonheme iron enzyme [Bacteroidota bacterium]